MRKIEETRENLRCQSYRALRVKDGFPRRFNDRRVGRSMNLNGQFFAADTIRVYFRRVLFFSSFIFLPLSLVYLGVRLRSQARPN